MTNIWPTEVKQCASSVIPVHQLKGDEKDALLSQMNDMFLRRQDPHDIQRNANILARKQEIELCTSNHENGLVVVGFAGGGGSCEGIKQALGYSPHIAMNHNPVAMAMHAMNHPETLHYPEDIFSVDPVISTGGMPVFLGWFSPDCRHFSKAKGATPVKKEIRGLAWVVLRWALATKMTAIMLENVEEFKTWSPLITRADGSCIPDVKRKGETFKAFIGMLSTGIEENHPALSEACEFLKISIDSDDAKKLITGLGYNVDFKEIRASDLNTPTIRKRLYMIARNDGLPVSWPEAVTGDPASDDVKSGKLKPWKTAADCIDWSIPCPSIFGRKKPLAENTLKRIARGLKRFVIDNPTPFIVKCNHTSNRTSYECFRGQGLSEPLQTVTQTHGYALVSPYIARIGQTGFGGDRMAYNAKDPLTTVTSKGEHLLVAPIITRQFGNSVGHGIDEPNGTITAGGGGKSQLVTAFLAGAGGAEYQAKPKSVNKPYNTITAHNRGAIVTSHLIKLRGTCKDGQTVVKPMPTITAQGLHIGEVRAFLLKYYGNEKDGAELTEPMHTVTSKERFGLVTVEGIDYQIVDIGMRMLSPRELYNAQGFPADYIIDVDADGNKISKADQVARCGNAVCPPVAEALVRANFPEICVKRS